MQDGFRGYVCQCQPGFVGKHCEVQQSVCASSPCQNGAQCVATHTSYQCQCVTGYTGTHCEVSNTHTRTYTHTISPSFSSHSPLPELLTFFLSLIFFYSLSSSSFFSSTSLYHSVSLFYSFLSHYFHFLTVFFSPSSLTRFLSVFFVSLFYSPCSVFHL